MADKYIEFEELIEKIQELDYKTDNIFKILHQESYENKHSTFLSWLFNPKASHGLGSKFAEEFFKRVSIRNLEGDDLKGYTDIDVTKIKKVRTEVPINGEEQIKKGIERKRIDLLLEGDDFTCTIENKYGSKTHGGQCKDYREFIQGHTKYKKYGLKNKFVFLDIEKPKDFNEKKYANYDFISYREIIEIIKSLKTKEATRQSDYIQQYLDILEEKYNEKNDNEYMNLCDKYKEKLSYKVITDICSISSDEYNNLEYDSKRFVDVIRDYYDYRKKETDKEIKDNLLNICQDRFFFKDDYNDKTKSSDGVKYAYTIPTSIDRLDKKEYEDNWKKELKEKSYKDTDIKKIIKEKIKEHKNDNIPFNSIDFRAPDMECENKTILLLAGFIPSLSKNIMDKLNINSIDLNKLKDNGWETSCFYYLKSGAGTGEALVEFPIAKDLFYTNTKDVFNYAFGERKELRINAEDIFSDEFWNSLDELNKYVGINCIQRFLVEYLIFNNSESINASKKFINNIKSILKLIGRNMDDKDSSQSKNDSYPIDFEKITCMYDDEQKSLIEQGIKDNYEIIKFKKSILEKIKSDDTIKSELQKFVIEEMKKDNEGKIVSSLLNALDDKKKNTEEEKKAIEYLKSILKKDKKNSNKNYALDIDTVTDEIIKNVLKDTVNKKIQEIICDLVDQRKYKQFLPGIYIRSLYEIKEDQDQRKLKEIFYEETIKIAEVYGYKEWFEEIIFKPREV